MGIGRYWNLNRAVPVCTARSPVNERVPHQRSQRPQHVAPHPFSRRLRSLTTLVPRSGLDQPKHEWRRAWARFSLILDVDRRMERVLGVILVCAMLCPGLWRGGSGSDCASGLHVQ